MNLLIILLGKTISKFSKLTNLGNGSTWPGHLALSLNNNFLKDVLVKRQFKIILVAGTNGKTTTGKLIQTMLEEGGKKVFQNDSGANLINGIASAIIKNSSTFGKLNYDFAIFEVDENTVPVLLQLTSADFIVCLNLFRDQLDRYGEVNIILEKWKKAFLKLPKKTKLILNADDPKIAYLGSDAKNVKYFGVSNGKLNKIDHASDSSYCPKCGNKLIYKSITFSHLGDWTCRNCKINKPKSDMESFDSYPLPGIYNRYNTNAAILTVKSLGVSDGIIKKGLRNFKPAFGRQEILEYEGRKIQIFLSKNPASFNQSLVTINNLKAKNLLVVLNDRIPDGRDVSWIWDVDFENNLKNFKNIFIAGDRVYDMALRIQYSTQNSKIKNQNYNSKVKIYEDLKKSVGQSINDINQDETLFILPTYSAMLDLRKILKGKKIL